MKNTLTLIALIILSVVQSQTILTINQSPGSLDDGFSLGIGLEKQESLLYYGAEIYAFPQLNGIDYGHLLGRFGLGINLDRFQTFKIIGGVRGGLIYRGDSLNYANMGVEGGLQIKIGNVYGMLIGSIDSRTDSKYYSNVDHITVKSVWVKIGIGL